jgi:hypothetical protein
VTRALGSTLIRAILALAAGVAAAAGLAAFRGGRFAGEFEVSLWIVGCVMLLLAVCSFSPTTRRGPGELSSATLGRRFLGSDDRGGAGLTVVLGLSALGMFGIALLVG